MTIWQALTAYVFMPFGFATVTYVLMRVQHCRCIPCSYIHRHHWTIRARGKCHHCTVRHF